jgi:glycosyltransferase involved in cell wall biosynthesis
VGLSILIPVYNFDVSSLVNELSAQLTASGKEGEIILLDDGSDLSYITSNQLLQKKPSISFHRNLKNEGRMASRLLLSQFAQFNYFLFLDCDSEIIKKDFLETYFETMEMNIDLASGGRNYSDSPPAACEYRLHWKYGSVREGRKRGDLHAPGFMSNNFLIKKEIFYQLDNFLELPGYGHEDSFWGIQFEQAGVKCNYINNPVIHASLEKTDNFLAKSENALGNLLFLEKNIGKTFLSNHVKIFRWYCRFKKTGLSGIFLFLEKPFHKYFLKNLRSCQPKLYFFDFYRLAQLIRKAKSAK